MRSRKWRLRPDGIATVKRKTHDHHSEAQREMQAAGVKFGCFVDAEIGETQDNCVKDEGDWWGCVHSQRHRTREGCPYWREVVEIEKDGGR